MVWRVLHAILGVTINSLEYTISKMTDVKRPYRSRRRREQAEETRRRILTAARRLFVDRGYGGATMEGIYQCFNSWGNRNYGDEITNGFELMRSSWVKREGGPK